MFYQINYSKMAAVLAEDVYAPELRNPLNSGMIRERKQNGKKAGNLLGRLFG